MLGLTVLVLCAAPRAGIKVGPAPLYLVDLLLFVTAVLAFYRPSKTPSDARRVYVWMGIYLIAISIGQFNAYLTYGAIIEPAYVFVRYVLSFSLLLSVVRIIQSPPELIFTIKMAMVGVLITSLITIGVSLPFTRSIVQSQILSNKLLEPADVNDKLDRLSDEEKGTRGRSLIGASTMTGGFLNVLWPLSVLLLITRRYFPGFVVSSHWIRITAFLCAFATILTYGRGAILGLAMAGFVILSLGKGGSKKNLLVLALGAVIVIGSIGVESEIFYFDRVVKKTVVLLDGDFTDDNEQGRVRSFVEPWFYLLDHPESIILGQGNTRGKVGRIAFAAHFSLAAAYHYFGLIGAFAFVILNLLPYLLLIQAMRISPPDSFAQNFSRMMIAAFVAMIPWLVLGHAAASMPRGSMLFFFVIGLAIVARRFAQVEAIRQAGRDGRTDGR